VEKDKREKGTDCGSYAILKRMGGREGKTETIGRREGLRNNAAWRSPIVRRGGSGREKGRRVK